MKTQEALKTETEAFLSSLAGWPEARFSCRPAGGGWSALQVLEHLVKTEEEILIQAKQGAASPHPIGIRDGLGFLFLVRVFQTDRKVKTPRSASQLLPGPELAFDVLCKRWEHGVALDPRLDLVKHSPSGLEWGF